MGEERITCLLPHSLIARRNAVAVGDAVMLAAGASGQYRLAEVLPRRSALYRGNRKSPGEDILVAANADLVLAVITAEYLLHQTGFPESAILAARRAGMKVCLYVSKLDTVGEEAVKLIAGRAKVYEAAVEGVYSGTPRHMDEALLRAVKGKTVVCIGDRGSGKTTLLTSIVNRLEGRADIVRTASTSAGSLISCADGSAFIDTPGFRDFALTDATGEELRLAFPEIADHAQGCGFQDCTHTHESGCGVLEAVRAGEIQRDRYNAWLKLCGVVSIARPETDFRHSACTESFICKVCGAPVTPEEAGTRHRNHCPHCLSSVHVDNEPGDRASLCRGVMDPIGVWVRKDGEWAVIHRCRACGALSSNRIAADDNPLLLMSIAVKPLSRPPFPLNRLEQPIG